MSGDSEARLRKLVCDTLADVKPSIVKDETHFERDLGGDSIDAMELIMAIEDAFDIDLAADGIEAVETFGDLRCLVDRTLGD